MDQAVTIGAIGIYDILDEDNMASNSDRAIASQQSIKAYVDAKTSTGIVLTDTVWDDIRVPVLSTKVPAAKNPGFEKVLDNGAGSQGIFTYLFDAATEEELYFTCQIPHSWKLGTDLHPHVHWMPVSNGSAGQVVSWGLEYSVAKVGVTFPVTTIMYGNVSMPTETLVVGRHYITDLGDIIMSGVDSVSPMLICRVFRDATGAGGTDSYADDAALIEIDFHFEADTLGSNEEYAK